MLFRGTRAGAGKAGPAGSRKGSLIVETAIFLPIFIISILTLSALIKAVGLQTVLAETFADEARKFSVQSYVFENLTENLPEDITGLAVNAADQGVCLQQIRSALRQRGIDPSCVKLDSYVRGLTRGGISDVTEARISYDMKIALPAPLIKKIAIENVLYYRDWDGENLSGELFSFERMMVDEDGRIVCVFPNSGTRYHTTTCRYVNSYAVETVLTAQVMREYDPCPLCIDEDGVLGERVYVFRYGNSYHRASCNAVKKYVIEMDREDAKAKGYFACSVCGG